MGSDSISRRVPRAERFVRVSLWLLAWSLNLVTSLRVTDSVTPPVTDSVTVEVTGLVTVTDSVTVTDLVTVDAAL